MTREQILRTLLEFEKFESRTFEESKSSTKNIILALSELVESVADAKVKTTPWRYHAQTLVGKIIFTSHSILSLTNGFEYAHFKRNHKAELIDCPSIFVLTRALIENYITLCYIYNNNLAEEEKMFRYKLWEVSGLLSRQNLGDSTNDKIIQKKESEKKLIDKIFAEIQSMPEYKQLEKPQLRKLQKFGLPRISSWHGLIEKCEIGNEIFSSLYSYFSSYAHSEYLSILQLSQSSLNKNSKSNIDNIEISLNVVRMIISMSIDFYITSFKSAEIIYNTFPESIIKEIKIWKLIGKGKVEK